MPRTHDPLKILRVSRRDREIYQQVVVQQLTQRQVANLHKLSQPRVCNIVHRVARWLSETAPAGLEEIPRPQRLYLAARTYQMKLQWYEQQAKRAFEMSQQESFVSTHELKEGEDGKLSRLGPGKLQRKNPKPDARLLLAGQKFAQAQIEFDGFTPSGEVNMENEGRLYEEPERGREETLDELTRRALTWATKRQLTSADAEVIRSDSAEPVIKSLSDVSAEVSPSAAAEAVSAESEKASLLSRNPPAATEVVSSEANALAEKLAQPLSTAQPGSGSFSGSKTVPLKHDSDPKIIPTPLCAPSVSRVTNSEGVGRNFGTTSLGQGRVHLPENSPNPAGRKKEPPPAPAGYHRVGDECRQIPTQSFKDDANARRMPGMRVSSPRAYGLDPRRNEWVAVA